MKKISRTQTSCLARIYPAKQRAVHTKGRGKKTRTKGGSLASVIPELENCVACEGSRKKGGKAALVVGGSGRCQGQIQLLTPENTETVITETRETVDRPLCLHPLTLPLQESFSFAPPFFTRASRIRRSSTISDLLFSESSSTWEEKKKKKERKKCRPR